MKFRSIKFPLADAALRYWNGGYRPSDFRGGEEGAWIEADSDDEARSAPISEGGLGMPSAFGDEGIDRRTF